MNQKASATNTAVVAVDIPIHNSGRSSLMSESKMIRGDVGNRRSACYITIEMELRSPQRFTADTQLTKSTAIS